MVAGGTDAGISPVMFAGLANMGALSFVEPKLRRLIGPGVRTIKRAASATPATGSHKAHELEQKTLLNMAFTSIKS